MKFEDCKDYKKCEDGFYRYVYVTICTNPNYKDNFYIGKHKHKHILNNYTGSGKLIKQYIKEYPDEYIKLILGTYLNNEEQSKAELYFINKYFNEIGCLNICKHSAIYNQSVAAHEKKSLFMKEWWQNSENRIKVTETRKTPEFKKRNGKAISEALKGEKNPMYGKIPYNKGKRGIYHRSEEAINKCAESIRGCAWMTDNISEYLLKPEYWGEFIDIGFKFGRKRKK